MLVDAIVFNEKATHWIVLKFGSYFAHVNILGTRDLLFFGQKAQELFSH